MLTSSSSVVSKRLRSSPVTAFKYRDYGAIVNYLFDLQAKYPTFLTLYSAQEAFGLPSPSKLQCDRNGRKEPCQQYILRITEHATLPDKDRPEVFFSGALHGDERVGPLAVTELAALLLDHASRVDGNPWIQQLVKTRSIFLMPTTNAYGYNQQMRTEAGVDPNRDFSYLQSGTACMKTMTARAVNELWIRHAFQLAVTFHGGMRAVSYEWGSTNHYASGSGWGGGTTSEKSPDHEAQWYLGLAMSKYGGAFSDQQYYPHGPMNDIVYGVKGGMEDWGYAASWENQVSPANPPIGICEPTTYGGYPASKTKYGNASHRSFNILVETSDRKTPRERELGTNEPLLAENLDMYLSKSHDVGHVARNVRLALLYIDLVQPYINWVSSSSSSETETDDQTAAAAGDSIGLSWQVLGAFTVDETHLEYSTNARFDDDASISRTQTQSGATKWRHEEHGKLKTTTSVGVFSAQLAIAQPGTYYVRARAKVDQNWLTQGSGKDAPAPNVKPMTHIVNARTDATWRYENNGHRVQGHVYWYSSVVTLRIR